VADFDKLPIPYRSVATDMLTGDTIVLDHGDIANAMRASMAIPAQSSASASRTRFEDRALGRHFSSTS
jgi:hypothetical protein